MAYRFTSADRAAFKRCRRQWDFGARERQNLEPVEVAAGHDLELAVRDALAVYYFPGMWDWQRSVVLPLVLQGLARSAGRQPGAGGQAEAMLRRYFDWAPGVDHFSPVQVECSFEVNLPDPAGGGRELVLEDGRPIRYQGRVDLLAGDEHDRYWVVAHRVVDHFGAADDLLLDEELVAACWAMERFYPGMRIAGTVHNELLRPPTPPAGAAPPSASSRRARRRRLRRHPRGLPQHEASGGGRSLPYARRGAGPRPPDPAEVASEGDGEFRRTRILRGPAELAAMGARLAAEALDMVDPGLRIYPSPAPSTAATASSWPPAWPSSAATSAPCSSRPTATGARSGSSRAASAAPPGARAAAPPHPGSGPTAPDGDHRHRWSVTRGTADGGLNLRCFGPSRPLWCSMHHRGGSMSELRGDTFRRPEDLVDPGPGDRAGALYARSYLLIRMIVGIIGIALPIILILGEVFILKDGVHVRGSISAYYHTSVRDVFVAGLCVTGFFLGTYMAGQSNKDFWWSLVAGVAVIGVVFFPTQRPQLLDTAPRCGVTPTPAGCSPVQQWLGENLVATLHFAFAAIFILSLARIGFLFAKREKELEKDAERQSSPIRILSSRTARARILYACSWVIVGAVGLAIVGATIWKFTIWELTPLYLAEVASVWAFGVAWLLKSRALWAALFHPVAPSAPQPGPNEPVTSSPAGS